MVTAGRSPRHSSITSSGRSSRPALPTSPGRTSESAAVGMLDDGETERRHPDPRGLLEGRGGRNRRRRSGSSSMPDSPLGAQIATVGRQLRSPTRSARSSWRSSPAPTGRPGSRSPAMDAATVAAIREPCRARSRSTDSTLERRQATTATFYAAAMAIMFLFFATIYGPIGLLGERRLGTLARLLAAPIRPASIVLGASITSFVLGIVSMTVLVVGNDGPPGRELGPAAARRHSSSSPRSIAAMGVSILDLHARPNRGAGSRLERDGRRSPSRSSAAR